MRRRKTAKNARLQKSNRELERSSRYGLQTLASVTSARLDQMLIDSSRLAAKVARDDAIVARCQAEGDPTPAVAEAVQRDLKAVVETNPAVASIFVIGRDGHGLASTNPLNIGLDLSSRAYVQEARAGRSHVSDPIVGTTTGEMGVYIAVPVRAARFPSSPGALVIKLDGERIWEIVNSARIGDQGFAVLADHNGVVLSHPQKDAP